MKEKKEYSYSINVSVLINDMDEMKKLSKDDIFSITRGMWKYMESLGFHWNGVSSFGDGGISLLEGEFSCTSPHAVRKFFKQYPLGGMGYDISFDEKFPYPSVEFSLYECHEFQEYVDKEAGKFLPSFSLMVRFIDDDEKISPTSPCHIVNMYKKYVE